MADFSTPFGEDGERRLPTTPESEQGFLCGAASRDLFNGLFHRIEAELGEVIEFAGITPTNDRFTQVREAIEALIAAATGGGDTSQFLLVSQARARLPIFPDVQTTDGLIPVVAPSTGTVRVSAGYTFMHRGIYPIQTGDALEAARTFATDVSKTYHLRWNPTDGYSLKDLASGVYNPGALADANVAFDSTYDDMLIARVITNSSNVATITNLKNKHRMESEQSSSGVGAVTNTGGGNDGVKYTGSFTLNWARRPRLVFFSGHAAVGGAGYVNGFCNLIQDRLSTRYLASASVETDYLTTTAGSDPQGSMYIQAMG